MNEQEFLDLIEAELEPRQPQGYRLNLNRDAVRHDGNWWYVVVKPDRNSIRVSDYNSVLAAVEEAIEDATDVNVLLVPALPD